MYSYDPTQWSSKNNWWLSDTGQTHGPLTWDDIVYKVQMKQVTNKTFIKNASWPNWVPITLYFHPSQLINPEVEGLVPGRYDLMYYGGVGLFILGVFVSFAFAPLGFLLLMISIITEIIAVYLDHVNKIPSTASKLGNICAGAFIIFQIAITLLLMYMFMLDYWV